MPDETVYRYCPDCAQWRNMLVSKRVGFVRCAARTYVSAEPTSIRVECDGCGRTRVIADPKATVR